MDDPVGGNAGDLLCPGGRIGQVFLEGLGRIRIVEATVETVIGDEQIEVPVPVDVEKRDDGTLILRSPKDPVPLAHNSFAGFIEEEARELFPENTHFKDLALRHELTHELSLTLSHAQSVQRPMRYFGVPLVDGAFAPRTFDKNYNVADSFIAYRDRQTSAALQWVPGAGTTPTNGSWEWLLVDAPHSGTPFDLAHTIGTALAVIGLCLLLRNLPVAVQAGSAAIG